MSSNKKNNDLGGIIDFMFDVGVLLGVTAWAKHEDKKASKAQYGDSSESKPGSGYSTAGVIVLLFTLIPAAIIAWASYPSGLGILFGFIMAVCGLVLAKYV